MDNPKGEKLCNCGPETYLHGKTGTAECGPGNNKIKSLTAVAAVQDNDSHWYVVPAELKDEFHNLLEMAADYNNEPVQEQAEIEFDAKFTRYRTGGDLNIVQLYAEIKPE